LVEVKNDEEGYDGSWFGAIIVWCNTWTLSPKMKLHPWEK
jgi:hypothetical protein